MSASGVDFSAVRQNENAIWRGERRREVGFSRLLRLAVETMCGICQR